MVRQVTAAQLRARAKTIKAPVHKVLTVIKKYVIVIFTYFGHGSFDALVRVENAHGMFLDPGTFACLKLPK